MVAIETAPFPSLTSFMLIVEQCSEHYGLLLPVTSCGFSHHVNFNASSTDGDSFKAAFWWQYHWGELWCMN